MASSAGFAFGAVVLVPFPFSDQSGAKKRPAVVISGSAYIARRDQSSRDFIGTDADACITSAATYSRAHHGAFEAVLQLPIPSPA